MEVETEIGDYCFENLGSIDKDKNKMVARESMQVYEMKVFVLLGFLSYRVKNKA